MTSQIPYLLKSDVPLVSAAGISWAEALVLQGRKSIPIKMSRSLLIRWE